MPMPTPHCPKRQCRGPQAYKATVTILGSAQVSSVSSSGVRESSMVDERQEDRV